MKPDKSQAREYQKLIDPNAAIFTWQTFTDSKPQPDPDPLARITIDKSAVLDLYQRGAGVWITVNETDGKGRKRENIKRIRAVWQEDDDGFEGEFPLDPSLVIETSEGHYHRYWLVADDWPADEKGRADFAAVMERMVESYGSDKNAKDIPRVLRVPGFYHRKDPDNPRMVRIVGGCRERYTRAQILQAFPPVERKANGHANGHTSWHNSEEDPERVRDALSSIPAHDRDVWVRIGMGLKDELGEAGYGLWLQWSQTCPEKFDAKDCRHKWESFKGKGITIATVFGMARDNGWREDRQSYSKPPQWNGSHWEVNGSTQASPKAYEARCMADVKAEAVDWLWNGRIALGKLNLVAGNPGGGKSQLTCLMAACASTGRPWPDGTPCPQGSVIVISCEDDLADTVLPRMMAAGAALERVHKLDYIVKPGDDGKPVRRLFDLGRDIDVLEAMIRDIGDVRLVIVDPITAYLGRVDSHKNAEVRGALAPLQDLAGRSRAAFFLVSHLSKGGADANAMARVSGSFAWVAICRSAWLLEVDPKDPERKRRVLAPLKNNLGDDRTGFALHIEPVLLPNLIQTSRVVFESGPVDVSLAELLNGQQDSEQDRSALEEAKDFLHEYLAEGQQNTRGCQKAAEDAGISQATLRRARKLLGIRAKKSKVTGYWVWDLPEQGAQNSPSPKHEHVEHHEHLEHLEGAQGAQDVQDAQEYGTG